MCGKTEQPTKKVSNLLPDKEQFQSCKKYFSNCPEETLNFTVQLVEITLFCALHDNLHVSASYLCCSVDSSILLTTKNYQV